MNIFFKHIKKIPLIITIIISLFAIFLSIQSNKISKEATHIAGLALEFQKSSFIREQRPYIILEPRKNKEFESLFKVDRKNEEVIIETVYAIKNIGQTPARNISWPDEIAITKKFLKKVQKVHYESPGPVTLAPGASLDVVIKIIWSGKEIKEANKLLEDIESGNKSLVLELVVFYNGTDVAVDNYRTLVKHQIGRDEAILIKSEID